jgi:hypothetical protein
VGAGLCEIWLRVGAEEVGAEEVGAEEVGAEEVGAEEVGAEEVGAGEYDEQTAGARYVSSGVLLPSM